MSARRRPKSRLAAAGTSAAALLVVLAVVVLSGVGAGGGGPATGAAALVPGDALAYVHVSTDPRRAEVGRALKVAERFPDYPTAAAAVLTRLTAIVGGPQSGDFAHQVRPWLGKEVALAFLNTEGTMASSLLVLDVRNRGQAEAFVKQAGATPSGSYDGARLFRYPSGTELAFVSHYLTAGDDGAVRSSLDAATGRAPSLQSDPGYRQASAGAPSDRVLDLYASATGVERVLTAQGGVLAAISQLLYGPALRGVAVSVSPTAAGARVTVHSALDPAVAPLTRSAGKEFTPTLQDVVPSGSALLFDVDGLARVAPRLLGAATTSGLAGRLAPLLSRLGGALAAEGVNLRGIVSIFSGETAVAVTTHGSTPSVTLVTRTHSPGSVQATLGDLELPLSELFPPPDSGPGQAPVFNDRPVAGITAHQLALAPGLQFDYAVYKGLVVFSTSRDGIGDVVHHVRAVSADPGFGATLGNRPSTLSSLLFLDFSQLLSLGEQTGLLGGGRYATLRADLEKIRAIGLASTRGEADTTAELSVQIS